MGWPRLPVQRPLLTAHWTSAALPLFPGHRSAARKRFYVVSYGVRISNPWGATARKSFTFHVKSSEAPA